MHSASDHQGSSKAHQAGNQSTYHVHILWDLLLEMA